MWVKRTFSLPDFSLPPIDLGEVQTDGGFRYIPHRRAPPCGNFMELVACRMISWFLAVMLIHVASALDLFCRRGWMVASSAHLGDARKAGGFDSEKAHRGCGRPVSARRRARAPGWGDPGGCRPRRRTTWGIGLRGDFSGWEENKTEPVWW
jgi:hypothetical protein